ncbi:MAG: hypothetical protein QOD03_1564 [Verrucomicrobiota bacterium]|jgi:hypothetical protein
MGKEQTSAGRKTTEKKRVLTRRPLNGEVIILHFSSRPSRDSPPICANLRHLWENSLPPVGVPLLFRREGIMRRKYFFLVSLLLVLIFTEAAEAADPNRYSLSIAGLRTRPGDETQKTIQTFTHFNLTNTSKGVLRITNWSSSYELDFKEKVLVWDNTNGYAKMEIVLYQCRVALKNKTNELVKSGTRLQGTFIAGEWFFHSSDEPLSDNASRVLNAYFRHPRHADTNSDTLKLNQPRSIGEKWKIEFLPDELNSRLSELGNSFSVGIGRAFAKGLNPDNTELSAQFGGTTNIFGAEGFCLRLNSNIVSPMKIGHAALNAQIEVDLPWENSHRSWIKNLNMTGSLSFYESLNATNTIPLSGTMSVKSVETCHEVARY